MLVARVTQPEVYMENINQSKVLVCKDMDVTNTARDNLVWMSEEERVEYVAQFYKSRPGLQLSKPKRTIVIRRRSRGRSRSRSPDCVSRNRIYDRL